MTRFDSSSASYIRRIAQVDVSSSALENWSEIVYIEYGNGVP